MTIGFIGCGNMASAIIEGIIKSGVVDAGDIYSYDVSAVTLIGARDKYGICPCESEIEVAEKSDMIILAVKPNVLAGVLEKIDGTLSESDSLLVSIAAGKTIDFIRKSLSHGNRIIRVMPNINAVVGEAICAYTANELATQQDKETCEKIFSSVGEIIYLDESQFPQFGVLGGCTPAFAYMFIDALARAGVKNGMKKDIALKVAAQAVLGSAKMILEAEEHPWELVDKVCSPGGTTIEGVTSLQNDGLEAAVQNAVDRAIEKDARL